MQAEQLTLALQAWESRLGAAGLQVGGGEETAAAARATFDWNTRVLAILRPADRLQVRESLRIASEHRIPIYPISQGKNWGLGSKAPPRDAVLLDLSRLDRIVEYDENLAYITVEPGVTFQQASDYLREKNSAYFLAVTGGPPSGSVLGNVLERGEAAGPYGQRCEHVANMEVMLPSGATVHTGFGRFTDASTRHLHRHGVGPALDGLFTQSNFGVVTQLTLWLTHHSPAFRPYVGVLHDPRRLPALVDAARRLLLERVVEPCGLGFWNSFKYFASTAPYPWAAMQDRTPWDRTRFPEGPWFLGGAVQSASESIAQAVADVIEATLRPLLDDFRWLDATQRDNVYYGRPTEQNSRSVYWRKRNPPDGALAPEADQCGVVWSCVATPLLGDEVRRALATCEDSLWKYDFEPNLGFNATDGRTAHIYVSLLYDREVPGEDRRAADCHDELLAALARLGHHPYRLGLLSQNSLPAPHDDYASVWQALKQALDPHGVLAPGRYEPRR